MTLTFKIRRWALPPPHGFLKGGRCPSVYHPSYHSDNPNDSKVGKHHIDCPRQVDKRCPIMTTPIPLPLKQS